MAFRLKAQALSFPFFRRFIIRGTGEDLKSNETDKNHDSDAESFTGCGREVKKANKVRLPQAQAKV